MEDLRNRELPASEPLGGDWALMSVRIDPGGPWEAIRSVRLALRALRGAGVPRILVFRAVSHDGRVVPAVDPDAAILLVAYRLDRAPSPA